MVQVCPSPGCDFSTHLPLSQTEMLPTPPRLIPPNSSIISSAVPHHSPAPAAGDWEDTSNDFHHNSFHFEQWFLPGVAF